MWQPKASRCKSIYSALLVPERTSFCPANGGYSAEPSPSTADAGFADTDGADRPQFGFASSRPRVLATLGKVRTGCGHARASFSPPCGPTPVFSPIAPLGPRLACAESRHRLLAECPQVPLPGGASKREPLVVEGLSRDIGNGPIRAHSEVRKGQRWRVKVMQELIEFYEMVALNDAALRGSEKTAILRARLALSMFERAMESLKRASTGAPSEARGWFRIAA